MVRHAEIEFTTTREDGSTTWGSELRTLGELIRETRDTANVKLRELARRSGVSPGQVSRIESDQVARPSEGTLRSLARSLGRSEIPLYYLAALIDESELRAHAQGILAHSDGSLDLHEAIADAMSAGTPELLCGRLWRLDTLDTDMLIDGLGDGIGRQFREIVHAWPAISETRRRLVLAFVDDQVVLSTAERMPTPPGRYDLSVELTERDDA